MRKGTAWSLLLIITVFFMVPVVYWYFNYRVTGEYVKGAQTSGDKDVLYVTISSKSSTWDLYSYLCKNKADCLETISSGDKLSTRSGGVVSDYFVNLSYENNWADYSYLKLFVKSGWGMQGKTFAVEDVGDVSGSIIENINSGDYVQDVVLIPIKELKENLKRGPVFSD